MFVVAKSHQLIHAKAMHMSIFEMQFIRKISVTLFIIFQKIHLICNIKLEELNKMHKNLMITKND